MEDVGLEGRRDAVSEGMPDTGLHALGEEPPDDQHEEDLGRGTESEDAAGGHLEHLRPEDEAGEEERPGDQDEPPGEEEEGPGKRPLPEHRRVEVRVEDEADAEDAERQGCEKAQDRGPAGGTIVRSQSNSSPLAVGAFDCLGARTANGEELLWLPFRESQAPILAMGGFLATLDERCPPDFSFLTSGLRSCKSPAWSASDLSIRFVELTRGWPLEGWSEAPSFGTQHRAARSQSKYAPVGFRSEPRRGAGCPRPG